jgi:MIT (microtubule interacting and transport) domain
MCSLFPWQHGISYLFFTLLTEKLCKETLKRALSADENGQKELAITLYSDAVEQILTIEDASTREKLNKFALSALERAELLKASITKQVNQQNSSGNVEPRLDNPSQLATSSYSSEHAIGNHIPNLKLAGSAQHSVVRGYTAEEKQVLEHTSHINSKVTNNCSLPYCLLTIVFFRYIYRLWTLTLEKNLLSPFHLLTRLVIVDSVRPIGHRWQKLKRI